MATSHDLERLADRLTNVERNLRAISSVPQLANSTIVDGAIDQIKLVDTGETFDLPADVVLRAIGQSFVPEPVGSAIALKDGRIATDEHGHTSHPKVWAGGDCRHGGRDLTVEAVQHGKLAAIDIDRALRA